MKNKLEDVRNHMVAAMEALNEEGADQATVERAKALSGLCSAYVNSVKVEIDAIRMANEVGLLPGAVTQPQKCEFGTLALGQVGRLKG